MTFHELLTEQKTQADRMLLRAIAILSVTCFSSMTLEQIFNVLASDGNIGGAINSFSQADFAWLKNKLTQLENTMATVSGGVAKLQSDEAALGGQVTSLQQQFQQFVQAMTDAEARLQASIDQLKNVSGSGDPDAINAVVADLESQLSAIGTMKDNLTSAAAVQQQIDVPASTGGGTTGTPVTIAPLSVNMLRSATQQFTASVAGSTFKANSGSVDTTGLYTPPTDTTITSDVVVATGPDGSTASASISIS